MAQLKGENDTIDMTKSDVKPVTEENYRFQF